MSEELRELDAEVAEKVMGYTRCSTTPHPTDNRAINGVLYVRNGCGDFDYGGLLNAVPEYTRDIAAAMQVVEKMRNQGWSFACTMYKGHLPYATFCKRTAISGRNAEAKTLPEAICRAALQAVAAKPETKENLDEITVNS